MSIKKHTKVGFSVEGIKSKGVFGRSTETWGRSTETLLRLDWL